MKDVIIKCDKGEVKKTLAYIEKKDRKVRWASESKPTEWGSGFDRYGVYLVIENDVLTFIELEEFEDSDKKGKDVVSAKEFLGKSKSPHIVIFRRGREVIAKDVATGNEGVAKCSPNDDFVFKTGASIAMARLIAKTPEIHTDDVRAEWKKALGIEETTKKVYSDADRNFKVGDRVVVRDWDDMEKEYGTSGSGTILCQYGFTDTMRHLCGRTATVTSANMDCIGVNFDDKSGDTAWAYSSDMFNPIDIPAQSKNPEAKFKVGDHVTLKEGLTVGKYYSGIKLLSGTMYDGAYHKRMKVVGVEWKDNVGTYFYECEGDFRYTFYYSEEMLDEWKESVIHEGDKVRIKECCTGMRYDTYYSWVKKHISDPDLLLAFERDRQVSTDFDYEVVKIAPHGVHPTTLAYIKYKGTFSTLCYLIEVKGLEKV